MSLPVSTKRSFFSSYSVKGASTNSGVGFGAGLGESLTNALGNPKLADNIGGTLNRSLFAEPPREIQKLRKLLDIALNTPDKLTQKNIYTIGTFFLTLWKKWNLPSIEEVNNLSADLSERPDLQTLGLTKKKIIILFHSSQLFLEARGKIQFENQFSLFLDFLKTTGKKNLRPCTRIVASLESAQQGPVPRLLKVLDSDLNREPDETLVKMQTFVSQCTATWDARGTVPKDKMIKLILGIEKLIKDQDAIFTKPYLSTCDAGQLIALCRYFTVAMTDNDPFAKEFGPIDLDLMGANLKKLEALVKRLCKEQSGTLAKTGHVVNKNFTDPMFDRAENLPRAMLGLSPSSRSPSSSIPLSAPSFAEPDRPILASGWLDWLSSGFGSLSVQTMLQFAPQLKAIVKHIDDQIPNEKQFDTQKRALFELLEVIKYFEQNPSSNTLGWIKQYLLRESSTFNAIKATVCGFSLPAWLKIPEKRQVTDPLTDPRARLMRQMQQIEASSPEAQWLTADQYKEKATAQKEQFIGKTIQFVLVRTLFISICKQEMTFAEICAVMASAGGNGDFKTAILRALGARRVGWRYYMASCFYNILNRWISVFVERATNAYFDEIMGYIAKGKTQQPQFSDFKDKNLGRIGGFLGALNMAYTSVAKKAEQGKLATGTIPGAVRQEMEQSEYNNGQSPDAIYNEFVRNLLKNSGDRTGFMAWFYETLIGNPEDIVKTVLESCVSNLKNSEGFSTTINGLLSYALNKANETLVALPAQDQPDYSKRFSETRKEQLTVLAKNLFSILDKDQGQVADELVKRVNGKGSMVDSVLLTDGLMQAIGMQIGIALETFVQEDLLQMLVCTSFKAANSAYAPSGPVPDAQTVAQRQWETEIEVRDAVQDMLERIVKNVIKAWQASGTWEQTETNKVIDDLRVKTANLITTDIGGALTRLTITDDPAQALHLVQEALDKVIAFNKHCQFVANDVKARFKSGANQEEVRNRLDAIAQQLGPLVNKLIAIKVHHNTRQKFNAIDAHLSSMQSPLNTIHKPNGQYGVVGHALSTLKKHINALLPLAPDLTTLKEGNCDEYCSMVKALKKKFDENVSTMNPRVFAGELYKIIKDSGMLDHAYPTRKLATIKQIATEGLQLVKECEERSNEILVDVPFVGFSPLQEYSGLADALKGVVGGEATSRLWDHLKGFPLFATRTDLYYSMINHLVFSPNSKHERNKG